MTYYKQRKEKELVTEDIVGYLEKLLTHIHEEDKKVLPKWRVKCIDLLNERIKDLLLAYYTKRFGCDKKYLGFQKEQN